MGKLPAEAVFKHVKTLHDMDKTGLGSTRFSSLSAPAGTSIREMGNERVEEN